MHRRFAFVVAAAAFVVSTNVARADDAKSATAPPAAATTTATCAGPGGTKCVAAVSASPVGKDELKRSVPVDDFFVDDHEVTSDEYKACVDFKACTPATKHVAKGAPVLVDWARAERYCAFAGKRLPSESEWEAAQRALSWTSESAPNVEWVQTWSVTPKQCPSPNALIAEMSKDTYFPEAKCGTKDVLDACDGAVLCGTLTKRLQKNVAAPSDRKAALATEDGGAAAIRCATSYKYLTKWPSLWTTKARARPTDPTPPTQDELAAFNSVEEDTLDVPPCPKAGRSFLTCRDPASYLKSNEPKIGVVQPYVENMGGAYTGVASDQNYTFVALARSSWAWLFDYDANVVRWHHVLRAMIVDSADRKDFIGHFTKDGMKRGLAAIDKTYAGDADVENLKTIYKSSALNLAENYVWQSKQPYTWLGSDEHFAYIKTMYEQGRMRAIRGNMLDVHAMHTIGEAAKKLKTPIHVYYPSNAAEFWPFNENYRNNVRNFPFDDESIVVQTISGLSLKTGFGQTGYWHYNVQYGHEQQELMTHLGLTREKQLLWHRVKTDNTEVTTCGLPSPDTP